MTAGSRSERGPAGAGREKISIGDYVMVLLDEWRTLVVPLLLVLVVAGGYLLTAVPRYVATGVIQVSTWDPTNAGALFDITGIGRPSPVETEVEILRSRRIVAEAIRDLGLNIEVEQPSLTIDLGVSLGGASPRIVSGTRIADAHNPVKGDAERDGTGSASARTSTRT